MIVQNKVLALLEQNRERDISGREIAETVGVSKSAVWKSIKKLQDSGYSILAAPNRGYRLTGDGDRLSENSINGFLSTKLLGRKLDIFKTIDSTNAFAKSLGALGAEHGHTIIAETQHAGKGCLDKMFFSPLNGGIYMSVILKQAFCINSEFMLTASTTVAICKALEELCGINAQIKWVNDVYSNGKKISGVLTNLVCDLNGNVSYAVVGIGINVHISKFPDELKDVATSVKLEIKKMISRNMLIALILNHMEKIFSALSDNRVFQEYKKRSCIIGKTINVLEDNKEYSAQVMDIDSHGSLILKLNSGKIHLLSSGNISSTIAK